MRLFEKIAKKIRFFRVKNKLGSAIEPISIGGRVVFMNPQCIYFNGSASIKNGCFFYPILKYAGVRYYPKIEIGDGCCFGKQNSIAAINKVSIGKNVLFAGNVHITDHSHGYEDISRPITPQQLLCKGPVVIDDDCWLGFNSEILSGVHIGKHCVVAAHAVVTKDVPSYCVVAGNPARIVKKFNFETQKWESAKK